jgi:hypothetical protein
VGEIDALYATPQTQGGGRPLDDGIAYVVVTVSDGKIIELKGCADRATAQAYFASREAPAAPVLAPPLANHSYLGGA